MTSVKQIQVVRHACRLLEEVAAAQQPIGVSDLARITGIDKSSAHRLAVTLQAMGWLERTEQGRWFLTTRLLSVLREGATSSLIQRTRSIMEQARDRSGETALLIVADGTRLLIANTIESRHSLRVSVTVGTEIQAEDSSALRAMAPLLSPTQLAAWRRVAPGLTDELLESTGRRGWGVNDNEMVDGTRAVGAALCDGDGQPIGALVLVGPIHRFTTEHIPQLGSLVAGLAAEWNAATRRREATGDRAIEQALDR